MWKSRTFHYLAQFRDDVPHWVLDLAERVLPYQAPPSIARSAFSLLDRPQSKTP